MATRASSVRFAIALLLVVLGLLLGWIAAYSLPGSQLAAGNRESTASGALALGTQVRGELTSASPMNSNNGSRFARYAVALDSGQFVDFSLRGAFHGLLTLFGPEGELIAISPADSEASEDSSTQEHMASLRYRVADAGTYTVTVSGRDHKSYGPFRLDARPLEMRNEGTLSIDEQVAGWLSGTPNRYRLAIAEPGIYRVTMSSPDVNTHLTFSGAGVNLEDHSADGRRDARISSYLEPGEYQLEARWAWGKSTGAYTLAVERQPLSEGVTLQQGGPLTPEQPLSGWFGGQALEYQLVVDSQALVTIDMMSSAIDSVLELVGEGVHLSDDDGGNHYNARLQAMLVPGTYTVHAGAYDFTTHGLFDLQANVEPMDNDALFQGSLALPVGEEISAVLGREGRHRYRLTINEAGRYTLTMRSYDIDAFLELFGPGINVSDDDSGGATHAMLQVDLTPGDYLVIARDYFGQSAGSYQLAVSRE